MVMVGISGCDNEPTSAPDETQLSGKPGYAGTAACAGCHAEQMTGWQDSHHDLAMQTASPSAALGNFADGQFEHNGITTRFYTENNTLMVDTDGPDGKLTSFPVRYTFGVYPLQQYLLELPDGKIQALSIAWDSRPAQAGGQRWFHLYGDEPIDHTDVLHWTKPSQNWETMCADCHSTNLVSRFDLESRSFETTWSEINVGCEACHGPGEQHVSWAVTQDPDIPDKGLVLQFSERDDVLWIADPESGNSKRSKPRTSHKEINACAGCHSRRSRVAEGNDPATDFLDTYMPATIEPPLYHRDGQILDEVYVYGSFLQSKMHAAGVSCSDCHDPHSLELRAPGPTVCLQCHAAETFATVEHGMHEPEIANCIDCHMPATTYMQVDARNDHSFRIPRPQITINLGIPNACNQCHADQSAEWALQAINEHFERSDELIPHWSEALAATGENNQPSMELLALLSSDTDVPAIIRASAASRLSLGDAPGSVTLLEQLTSDEHGLVRWGAARALLASDPQLAARFGPRLAQDDRKIVRLAAAEVLGDFDPVMLPTGNYAAVKASLSEYRAAQLVNNERAEAHVNIANMDRRQDQFDSAEQEYLIALSLNPSFVPAYVNLADLYRELDRESDSEAKLRQGIELLPEQPALRHSLGLSLVRQQKLQDALPELRAAADSPDAIARYALVYGVALDSAGNREEALSYLRNAYERFDGDPQIGNTINQLENAPR
jgi:predicted CXXCH cytochrome family protein